MRSRLTGVATGTSQLNLELYLSLTKISPFNLVLAMTYITQTAPISFWHQIHARLDAYFLQKREELAALWTSQVTTFETSSTVAPRVERDRQAGFALLSELSAIKLFCVDIYTATANAELEHQINVIRYKAQVALDVIALYDTGSNRLPSRVRAQEDLHDVQTRFAALASSGNSDAINAERQRLRTLQLPLYPIGREDGAALEQSAQALRTIRDDWQTLLDSRLNSVTIALTITDAALLPLLDTWGISYAPVAAEAPLPELNLTATPEPAAVEQVEPTVPTQG